MYIVGTSGHIDHGKTSLIMGLTNIDCDRLPEEKEREMTIDIGFASIDYPKLGTVSIIDVPGHERFIRNMVVGAWGIDLALLVVAVDDGWMPQTEDHFRVLQLLDIERIIIVLNKIDIVDDEMIEIVRDEVNEKLETSKYNNYDIVPVSAKTGAGLEELKKIILQNLKKLPKVTDTKKPYLNIDRVFISKGYGTVVTGTLKNGYFNEDDSVYLLPGNIETRIKRIESHFHSKNEGNPSQRTALNLSNVGIDEIKRGSILYKIPFFKESSDIITKIQLLDKKKKIKNNLGIEILIGTSDIKGKLILISEKNDDIFSARIKFDKPWYFYPGQPFIITNPGGFRVIGGGTVLLPHYDAELHKHRVKSALISLKEYSIIEIIEFLIKVNSYLKINELYSLFPEDEKKINKYLETLIDKGIIVSTENYIFIKEFYEKSIDTIVETINNNVGLNLKETSHITKINSEIIKIIIGNIHDELGIIEKDGRFFSGSGITEDTISENNKKILKDILNNGSNGIDLNKINNDPQKKGIKDLIKLEFLISLDGKIIYHKDIYNDLKEKIIKLFNTNEKISMADARDAVGLSRKYLIPLLNRIERDGLIKRIGDFRIKV